MLLINGWTERDPCSRPAFPLHFYTSPLLGSGQRAVGFPVIGLLFQQHWLLSLLCSSRQRGRHGAGRRVLNSVRPWVWDGGGAASFPRAGHSSPATAAVCLDGSSQLRRGPVQCSLPMGLLPCGCCKWKSQDAISLSEFLKWVALVPAAAPLQAPVPGRRM